MGEEIKNICVCGTSPSFSPEISVPFFYSSFQKESFNLNSEIPESRFLIAFNHNSKYYRAFIKSGGVPERAVMIRMEPISVFPAQYEPRVMKKYGLILSPGLSIENSSMDSLLGWPYQYHLNPAKPVKSDPSLSDILQSKSNQGIFKIENWRVRSHLLTMVAANKVSAISDSNYGVRRKLARELPEDVLEVFGPLWIDSFYQKFLHRLAVLKATLMQGTFPNLVEIFGNLFTKYGTARGSVLNKHELLRDSKFALVVENSNSIVTEKIFDAILNGAIPIYVGPDLQKYQLPRDIAIPIKGASMEILKILDTLEDDVIQNHLNSMSEFINSEKFWDGWAAQNVYKQIAKSVIGYLDGKA
jgi:hypothetical protein